MIFSKSQLMTGGLVMAVLAVLNNVKVLKPAKDFIGLGGKGLI